MNTFSKFNSGTYSSQWMILDYNIFEKLKGKNSDQNRDKKLFYILEQVPHNITAHDISDYLYTHSYFGSFNRAFFDETNLDLHTALLTNLYHTDKFQYSGSSRRIIFNHFFDKVNDLKTLKDLLRYNGFQLNSDFTNDPSKDSPGEGISARNDLSSNGYSGGIDTKVCNSDLVKQLTAIAICGPTNENNPNLTTFEWPEGIEMKHKGVPQRFDFPYILMSPNNICCDNINDVYQFE